MQKEYIGSGPTVDAAIDAACLMANASIDELEIEVLDMGSSGIFGLGKRKARVKVTLEVPDETAAPAAEKTGGFGPKRSKPDRQVAKKRPNADDIEIKPIITAENDPELAEKLSQRKNQPPREPRGEQRQPREPRGDRKPRPERKPQPERERATEQERTRRDANTTPVTAGEMADSLTSTATAFLQPIFDKLGVAPEIVPVIRDGSLWLELHGENLGLMIGRRGETLNALQYLTSLTVNKHRNDYVRIMLDVQGYRESREETLSALAKKMAEKAVRTGRRVELEAMNPNDRRVVHLTLQNDKRVETSSHGEEPYRRVVISSKKRGNRPRKPGANNRPRADKPQEQSAAADAE